MIIDEYIEETIHYSDVKKLFPDKPTKILYHAKMCKCEDCKKYFQE